MHETSRHFAVAAAAVVVAAAASGGSARSQAPSPTVTFVTARLFSPLAAICTAGSPWELQVTKTRGRYVGHRWDPQGERVALVSENESTWTLDVMRGDGTRRERLSTARRSPVWPFGEPAWSPNGELIAFIRDRSLFVVRPDGSGLRRLLVAGSRPLGPTYSSPSWSPEGDRIYVVHVVVGPVMVRLVSVRPDGSERRTERGKGEHLAYGTYSPDRTQVAWVHGPVRVHVASADGTAVRAVVPTVPWSAVGDPVWSPDGTAIAYLRAERPGWTTEVFTADVQSGEERRLTTNTRDERDVAWHPGAPRAHGRCRG